MKNVIVIMLACAISFGFTAGLVFLVTWAFSWQFTWKIAFGVWVLILAINMLTYKKKE